LPGEIARCEIQSIQADLDDSGDKDMLYRANVAWTWQSRWSAGEIEGGSWVMLEFSLAARWMKADWLTSLSRHPIVCKATRRRGLIGINRIVRQARPSGWIAGWIGPSSLH
jgi:hypothetical protein